MKKYILAVIAILAVNLSYGITAEDFVPPVDFRMYLAGNVGEVRENHFHSGIDIKTDGTTGKPIYAVADGHVARIAVSPTGYGYCLYVNHNNGTTSVYAHLERFNNAIEEYVVEQQYKRKTFNADLYLSRWELPVKQGEIIAYSGNSGSSAGPHLHFEIRDQATQNPLNFLALGYMAGIEDKIAPKMARLHVVNFIKKDGYLVVDNRSEHELELVDGTYAVRSGRVETGNICAFLIEVTDRKNGSDNTLGIYSLEQKMDGKRNFGFTINEFSFAETRYCNDYVEYPLNKKTRNEIIKCYVSPNNKLSIYHDVADNGIIEGSGERDIEIDIMDDAGNRSALKFTADLGSVPARGTIPENSHFVRWDKEFNYELNNLKIKIPAGMMYISNYLELEEEPGTKNALSPVYLVGDPGALTPLHAAMTLTIRTDSIPTGLSGKLCAVSIADNGRIIYEGGTQKGASVELGTRTFGRYFITYDTVPPSIKPEFDTTADLSGQGRISFKISDNLSGVRSFDCTIDGKWELFEYDKKNNRITHYFRHGRYAQGSRHKLKVTVTDNKSNQASEEYNVIF